MRLIIFVRMPQLYTYLSVSEVHPLVSKGGAKDKSGSGVGKRPSGRPKASKDAKVKGK